MIQLCFSSEGIPVYPNKKGKNLCVLKFLDADLYIVTTVDPTITKKGRSYWAPLGVYADFYEATHYLLDVIEKERLVIDKNIEKTPITEVLMKTKYTMDYMEFLHDNGYK